MMKKIVPCILVVCCSTMIFAGYEDGLIGPTEYEEFVEWESGLLMVDGGGANMLSILYSARLEVQSTSKPINEDFNTGGIWDIVLYGSSRMDYYAGWTDELTVRSNAIANLYGGNINGISSFQYAATDHINIYALPGWSWMLDGNQKKVGITGQWWDSTPFDIDFTANGESFGYDPVWMNINVIIPEPTTVLLLALGGFQILRKKR